MSQPSPVPATSLDRLEEFLIVAQSLNFTAAARQLGLPRATLSRRIASLEEDLGQPLFLRSTRGLTLSGAGELLFEAAEPAVRSATQAWEAVKQLDGTPRGRLRVSVPDTQAASPELFARFAADYPEVNLEVSVDPHRVDLVKEGIDVAVRFGDVGDDRLVAKQLWKSAKVLVATRDYLRCAPPLRSAEDIVHHRAITSLSRDGFAEQYWPLLGGGRVPVRSSFATTDIRLRIEAAALHLGLALVPRAACLRRLESSELVPLLEDEVGAESPVHLVYAPRPRLPLAMRLFLERAAEHYGRWSR